MPRASNALGEGRDERLQRLLEQPLVLRLARLEPRPVVVLGELREEVDGFGREAARTWTWRWSSRTPVSLGCCADCTPRGSPRDHRPAPWRYCVDGRSRPRSRSSARRAILDWYAVTGRPLAFRRTSDPYAVLVSEAIAQQTQAARAADRWERFMARFPTVESLADGDAAPTSCASGRASATTAAGLNLWRAARIIVRDHGGRVRVHVATLETLPGVGPYTARAVAAIAFGIPVGAVDTNVGGS